MRGDALYVNYNYSEVVFVQSQQVYLIMNAMVIKDLRLDSNM